MLYSCHNGISQEPDLGEERPFLGFLVEHWGECRRFQTHPTIAVLDKFSVGCSATMAVTIAVSNDISTMNDYSVRPRVIVCSPKSSINVTVREGRDDVALRDISCVYLLSQSKPESCLTKATSFGGTLLRRNEDMGSEKVAFIFRAV